MLSHLSRLQRRLINIPIALMLVTLMVSSMQFSTVIPLVTLLYLVKDFEILSKVSSISFNFTVVGLFAYTILMVYIHYGFYIKLSKWIDFKLWNSSE